MSNITLSDIQFKPASIVYSKVKRRLKSFQLANIIDEGEFPVYTKELLKNLRLGVYRERTALAEVVGCKACLPTDFEELYAAYKCSPDFACSDLVRTHIQDSSFSYVTDITREIAIVDSGCSIDCCYSGSKVLESVNVLTYIKELPSLRFCNFQALTLNPNVGSNFLPSGLTDIIIRDKILYTNFDNDFVFIKYYGFPIDDDGELLIPDIQQIETALEWHIIYNVLLSLWFDSSVPDIQNKWQLAEIKCNETFATAKNYLKTPAFAQMVNSIRTRRGSNMLSYLTKEYSNTNFQHS